MAVDTVDALMHVLRRHQLLSRDQLEELDTLSGRFTDPRALAKYLVQRSWLTVYQLNFVFQGQGQELIKGPYRILDCLGSGGVSQVFKAWHTRRSCVVALKVIRPEMLSNDEAVARFQREMRALAQSSHPNIVKAFDINLVGETHFFAMEYIEGNGLDKMVPLTGPLPVPRACDYIRQAALGLQHAHERGLIHRDIKPGNLLVNVAGTVVKVLDLGLARLSQSASKTDLARPLTAEGQLLGTPDYLAPEQAKDPRTVDIRADIYSLGCTFYFLLTGQPPFYGGTLMRKLYRHQNEAPPSGAKLRPGLPPAVTTIFQKMMAKAPSDRYQVPAQVAEALAPFCRLDAAHVVP